MLQIKFEPMKKYVFLILLYIGVAVISSLGKLLHWPQDDLILGVGFVIQISIIFALIILFFKRDKKQAQA